MNPSHPSARRVGASTRQPPFRDKFSAGSKPFPELRVCFPATRETRQAPSRARGLTLVCFPAMIPIRSSPAEHVELLRILYFILTHARQSFHTYTYLPTTDSLPPRKGHRLSQPVGSDFLGLQCVIPGVFQLQPSGVQTWRLWHF